MSTSGNLSGVQLAGGESERRLHFLDRPTVVRIKGTRKFSVLQAPRILNNTVINLQKGRKTFSRKIPASYKDYKIVKIVVYIFKHTRAFRVFGRH